LVVLQRNSVHVIYTQGLSSPFATPYIKLTEGSCH